MSGGSMNKKYVEDFKKGNLAVNCKTEDEAKRFIKWCYDNNMKWKISTSSNTNFNKNTTCYRYEGNIAYGTYDNYKKYGYTIVSFDEMFNDTFTKDDLEVGQMVECRNGEIYKLLPCVDKLLFVNSACKCMSINSMHEDLTSSVSCDFDIVKIYGFPLNPCNLLNFNINDRELLWQREEVKEMTVDEVSEILGYKVNIIGGDK